MALSPKQLEEMLANTRESASAFLDDMQHIREIVAKDNPSSGEIRRLSSVLRRLLVERDIGIIANPRLGRVKLLAPDNTSAYHAERQMPFMFYMSGRARILGGWSGTIFAFDVKTHRHLGQSRIELPVIIADGTVELRLDNFLTQRVLCYRGEWVSRQDVIKYVAQVASGVHSGAAKEQYELLLARIRSSSSLKIGPDGGIHVALFAHGVDVDETKFSYTPDALDPVLIELLAAATFLAVSFEALNFSTSLHDVPPALATSIAATPASASLRATSWEMPQPTSFTTTGTGISRHTLEIFDNRLEKSVLPSGCNAS